MKVAMFIMTSHKAANGFPILFFHKYWDILEEDVMLMINDIHANREILG